MKRNTKLTKNLLTRVVMGLLLLAMLGGVLTSCGARGGSKITTVTKGYSIGENLITEENGMTAEKLNRLADAIVANKNGAVIREQLVAAWNGYDMSAADFDDAKVADGTLAAHPENAAQYAVNVLQKADLDTTDCYEVSTGGTAMIMTPPHRS